MSVRGYFSAFLICGTLTAGSVDVSAASEWVTVSPLSSLWDCQGTCAATLFAGPQLLTDPTDFYGFRVPPWRYTYGNSWFLGGSLSHVLVDFNGYADIEGEVGLGKRFGGMHESEVWGAFYVRWKWFPWNRYVITTVAASTGLNYASGISDYEISQSEIGRGSHLLHYFSPEITFALPSKPEWELVLRMHHRSGGALVWGYTPLFKGVWGGSQYLVAGLRYHF